MKKLLLSLFALIMCGLVQAQTAYDAPGVFVCSQAAANLQSMTPFILGAQNPASFTVTYHLSQAEASNDTNPIAGTLPYCCNGLTTVYARVTSNSSGGFAISSFKVVWQPENFIPGFPELVGCESVQLPYTEIGAYYTEPNGQGFQYQPLENLYLGQIPSPIMYWYAGNETCHAEYQFYVYIDMTPVLWEPTLTNCIGNNTFNLNSIIASTSWFSFYHTEADAVAQINPIQNPEAYPGTDGEVIWVSLQSFCTTVTPLTLGFQPCTGNAISGNVRISANGSTCSVSDPGLSGCPVLRTSGTDATYAYTNASGAYMFTNVPEGNNTVMPTPVEPYISVLSPTSQTAFATGGSSTQLDFCVNESPYSDVRLIMQPLGNFRPNISTQVLLEVSNRGNTAASGTVTLAYSSSLVSYTSASVAPTGNVPGTLTFSYTLPPHAAQFIYVTFFTPTTTVLGDLLNFTANAVLSGDQDLANNSAAMNETVVNSYDPNDISVMEGAVISPAQATGYLHYMIRFQNTGTADALDVRIESTLSALLDASTFRPIAASHTYFTERGGSDVTFHFPVVNLPASSVNEEGSHGWVIFEAKPIAGIQVGDVIANQASIYFDTNPAIDTNTVTTTVQQLSVHQANADLFAIYPNPANGKFAIRATDVNQLDLEITDARGSKVMTRKVSLSANEATIDISGFETGLYFVKMSCETGSSVRKLMVK